MLQAQPGWIGQHPELIVIVAVVAALGVIIEMMPSKRRRRSGQGKKEWRRDRWRRDFKLVGETDTQTKPLDSADQLRLVMEADFTVRPVLNKSEARVFRELGRNVTAINPSWQVMAQVSLGEILSSKNTAAFGCINSKRVDFLFMDGECQPRHAIEYQGGAHYQQSAAARDAVKKEALRRAGIGYHEVVAGQTTPIDLRRLVEKLVDKPDGTMQTAK